jgi:surface antigen
MIQKSLLTVRLFAVTSLLTLLTSCAEQGGPVNKQQMGTLLGAAGGAAVGSQFGKGSGRIGMTALGTLAGAALGNSLGASLDRIDQQHAQRNFQQAMETSKVNQQLGWNNPDSGNSGYVTPTRTYQTNEGTYCREFSQKIQVGGKQQSAYGHACRQQDGTWRIVSTH